MLSGRAKLAEVHVVSLNKVQPVPSQICDNRPLSDIFSLNTMYMQARAHPDVSRGRLSHQHLFIASTCKHVFVLVHQHW